MARKAFGLSSLAVIAAAAVGLMVFTFLGTATGVAGNATAAAFGAELKLSTAVSSSSLVGPLPRVAADRTNTVANGSLVRIGETPPGGGLIQEIGALIVESKVDLTAGTARASSDTAHVGLLRTTPAGVVPGVPLVGGLLGGGVVPAAGTPYNRIDIDALHGIVNLDCDTVAFLRDKPVKQRLETLTKGSQILGVSVRDLGVNIQIPDVDKLRISLGPDHMAYERYRIDLAALGLPALPPPLNILNGNLVEITLYEVKGENLTTASLTNATVGVTVDMLRVRVLDRTTLGIEADLRVGHAEATLSNCASVPPTTQPPTTQPPTTQPPTINTPDVDVSKIVESINGAAVITQSGLGAGRGQEVEYSLSVFNQSAPGSCSIDRVVDQLPANTTFVSSAGDLGAGAYNAATHTVTWENLAIPGQVARRQGLVLRINESAPGGTYVNRFTATGTCGSFTAVAPGINVAAPTTQVLGRRFETPRTGVADTALLVLGGLMVAAAIGGTRALSRP